MTEDKECREEFELWARDNGYVVTRALDGEWYSQQGTDRAWDVWQAAWRRAAKPAVPEGWKPVPLEPTREMIDAAQECDTEGDDDPLSAWGMIYHAMVDAAPPLPVAQGWQSMDSAPKVDGEEILALVQWKWQKEPRRRILNWNDGIGKVGYPWPCWMCSVGTVQIPDEIILGWMPLSAAPTPPAALKEPT